MPKKYWTVPSPSEKISTHLAIANCGQDSTIMNEHQRETLFLRHLISYDESDDRRKLEESLAQAQRDERCVQRFASVTALFPLGAIAGVGYGLMLQKNFPYDGPHPGLRVLCEIGFASLICLVAFAGLLMGYRKKVNRLREECRRLVARRLDSHLSKPDIATLPKSSTVVRPSNGSLDSPSWLSNRLCG
jgi:hypothetical protein